MLKVLHTADWHLGKRLEQFERTAEHQHFLDWLVDTIEAEQIDVLILAGDIFDTGTPSNTALKLYYQFLWKVQTTCCREVIIIGGNHDSITTLNAPQDLLKIFNVHVVGGVPDIFSDQIIPIKNTAGKVELVVCAIPFLRDKDVRLSIAGETAIDLEARLKQGICDHYNKFKEHLERYKAEGIPVIATGHLFAAGASSCGTEKDIHVGNLGQIGGDQFPVEFDYIALGHLHRPQLVNNMDHIRYSGSPIPLSFSEAEDSKVVLVLGFENELKYIRPIAVNPCRKLIRIQGNLANVKAELELIPDQSPIFPAWVEVQLLTETLVHDLAEQLNKLIENKPFIDQIFTRQHRLTPAISMEEGIMEPLHLTDLDLKSVFIKRCTSLREEEVRDLLKTFDEAIELYTTQTN